jgi:hypothetical protein
MLTRDQKHHIFYRKEGFHNHIVHHILTLYGLGAPAEIIEQRYKENATHQRPRFSSAEPAAEDLSNPAQFKKYLGKEKYYHDFLIFWQNEFEVKGWENVLNEYVFAGDERADDLLGRLYAGKLTFSSSYSLQLVTNSRLPPSHYPPRIWYRIPPASHHSRSPSSSLCPRYLDREISPRRRERIEISSFSYQQNHP